MILYTHSNASYYLAKLKARSRAGGHHYLGNHLDSPTPTHNGAILDISKLLWMVVASASKAEVGVLFVNGQDAVVLRITLSEMDHPQPATPIRTNNSIVCGIINGTVKQKRSCAIDMRFYWIRDLAQQKQFHIYWAPGSTNLADYFTKHHPAHHHAKMRPIFLHKPNTAIETGFLRGCVDPRPGLTGTTDRWK
jgi:hypothetical protein